MLKLVLPRLAIAAVLWMAAYFAFFETVYLQDQAEQFGELRIVHWVWAFRAGTAVLAIMAALMMLSLVRSLVA
jgi:hypothetical protein